MTIQHDKEIKATKEDLYATYLLYIAIFLLSLLMLYGEMMSRC